MSQKETLEKTASEKLALKKNLEEKEFTMTGSDKEFNGKILEKEKEMTEKNQNLKMTALKKCLMRKALREF